MLLRIADESAVTDETHRGSDQPHEWRQFDGTSKNSTERSMDSRPARNRMAVSKSVMAERMAGGLVPFAKKGDAPDEG